MKVKQNPLTVLDYKRLTDEAFKAIVDGIERKTSISEFEKSYSRALKMHNYAKKSEYYAILDAVMQVYRATKRATKSGKWTDILAQTATFNRIFYACKRASESTRIEVKKDAVRRALDRGFIFFICTTHPNSASDHRDLQGKIYVDKNWRSRVKPELWLSVLSYIELRHIMTVQEVMGKPYWLTTRPYCRHRLKPIPIRAVLDTPQNLLVQTYAEVKPKRITSEQDYYNFRREVYQKLYDRIPVPAFDRKRRTK